MGSCSLLQGIFPTQGLNPGLEGPLEEYIRSNEWPMGKVMNCLRLAMVGGSNGLGIADIVTLIGKEEFAKRIEFIKTTLGC